uniref:Uncharacterized protein n=1 Tax=Oryza meridionalis TaxID=40149 RepID=A0A0E0CQH8_9ORYZ
MATCGSMPVYLSRGVVNWAN